MTKSRTLKAAMLVSVASIACLSFNNLGASADTLPSTGKSQADVSFTSNGGSTNPVDPDNPDNPGGGGTGNNGPLSLDAVPTYLNFGTHTQPNVDTAYTLLSKDASQESLATANDDKTQNVTTSGKKNGNDIIYTQVSDSRGTDAGWQLKAQLSDITASDGQVLTNASVVLSGGTPQYLTGEANQQSWVTAADANQATVATPIVLNAGASSTTDVATATAGSKVGDGQGMGVNQQYWNINNVQLHVKGGHAAAKNYSGNIVWTLNSTPTA